MSKIFIPGQLYTADNWFVRVGPYDLTDYCLGNARAIGILAEQILLQQFVNLKKPPTEQKSTDLIEVHQDGYRLWEVKTTRRVSVNIQPSYMKGAGRWHNDDRFARYLDSIHGIIVLDQRRLPVVSYCGIGIGDIREAFGQAPRSFPTDFIYNAITAK